MTPRCVSVQPWLSRLESGCLLAGHRVRADRLHAVRQGVQRRANVALGAAHVSSSQRARPQVRADFLNRGDDVAHRRRQHDDIPRPECR